MALTILQNPATASLAQSPIIFSVSSSTDTTSSGFQYVADLFYWTGSEASSGSAKYTLTKFPNSSKVGIFDFSKILNSTLTDLAIANKSNVSFFKGDFYTQFLVGNTYVTGSTHTISSVFKALDGYAIFQEPIGQAITAKSPHWPIMSDGPVSQSALLQNGGSGSVYTGVAGGTQPTQIIYSGSTGNGSFAVSTSTATTGQIAQFPMFPSSPSFPISTSGLEWYTIQAASATTKLGSPIYLSVDCIQKYPNVRVQFKNRFGQFDFINLYGASQNSFSTDRKVYQPQIGTWESSTLSYQSYDTQTQPYVVNARQSLVANTQWLPEAENDIIKEMLSSDEIYWIYNESTGAVRPLSITSSNISFKTGVVDKVIQYTFTFDWAQNYKLII
jgi:hypothetical protein